MIILALHNIIAQIEIEKGISLFEKITNPILAILLFALCSAIILLYRNNLTKDKTILTIQTDKSAELKALQLSKDVEVKELNSILLEVRESDKEMLVELKNVISRFIETEKAHSEMERAGSEILKRNNDLLIQIISKIEYSLKK